MNLEQAEKLVQEAFPNAVKIIRKLPNYSLGDLNLYNNTNFPVQADKTFLIQNAFIIAQNEELLGTIKDSKNASAETYQKVILQQKSNLTIIETLELINSKLNSLEIIGERLNYLENTVNKLERKIESLNTTKDKGKAIVVYDNIAY